MDETNTPQIFEVGLIRGMPYRFDHEHRSDGSLLLTIKEPIDLALVFFGIGLVPTFIAIYYAATRKPHEPLTFAYVMSGMALLLFLTGLIRWASRSKITLLVEPDTRALTLPKGFHGSRRSEVISADTWQLHRCRVAVNDAKHYKKYGLCIRIHGVLILLAVERHPTALDNYINQLPIWFRPVPVTDGIIHVRAHVPNK